jgi:hypothetical protein
MMSDHTVADRRQSPMASAAWAASAATAAMALGGLVLAIAVPASASPIRDPRVSGGGAGLAAFELLTFTALSALGAFVATRQPRNPVAWILCTTPFLLELATIAERVYWSVTTGHPHRPAADWLLWLDNWAWVPALVPFVGLLPLLFPTGRPPGARWRFAGWATVAGGVCVVTGFALTPGRMQDLGVDNPIELGPGIGDALDALTGVGFLLAAGGTVSGAASQVWRFRRARGVERLQLKWVTTALGLLGVVWTAMAIVGVVLPSAGESGGLDIGWLILLVGLLGVSATVAIATLRYRLYDIDVIINRALVYGSLTATLAGAYAGTVLLLEAVLRPVTRQSDLAIAGSTLAVAALFGPARARIQRMVDRRFFRRRFDAAQTLAAFGARVRDEVELTALSDELERVVAATWQPEHVSLWLRERSP